MEDNTEQVKPFLFTGTATGYFNIWIVNILLTLLTLGIYSAWAKVRTNQYFYGHMQVDGSSFQYLATPLQILRGRVFACLALLAYVLADWVSPVAGMAAIAILFAALPFIFVAAMSFRMRNTAYRGVTFAFKGDILRAYMILLLPTALFFGALFLAIGSQISGGEEAEMSVAMGFVIIGIVIVSGLFMPLVEFLTYRYVVTGARYGQSAFTFGAGYWDYYKLYLMVFGVLAGLGVVTGILSTGAASLTSDVQNPQMQEAIVGGLVGLPMMVFGLVFYLWSFAYFKVVRENLMYNNMQLQEGHYFESRMRVGYMMFLIFTNTLAVMLSLGLMLPWAKVRTARYRASTLSLVAVSDLDGFIVDQQEQVRALGEEMGGVFDLEIGV